MISFRWWVAQKEKNDQSIDCESSRWVLWTGSGYTTTCTWGQLLPGGFSAQSSAIFLRHLDLDATMYSREINCSLPDWSFTSPNVGRPSSAPSFSLKSLLPSSSQAWRSFCRLVILSNIKGFHNTQSFPQVPVGLFNKVIIVGPKKIQIKLTDDFLRYQRPDSAFHYNLVHEEGTCTIQMEPVHDWVGLATIWEVRIFPSWLLVVDHFPKLTFEQWSFKQLTLLKWPFSKLTFEKKSFKS